MPDEAPLLTRRRVKIISYLAAWLLALFATNPAGAYWPFVYMFPLGLAAFVFPVERHGSGLVWLVVLWLLYLAHAVLFFRTRTKRATILWFLLLALLLTCNVAGCRNMLNTH
jgi:hypothetical protein